MKQATVWRRIKNWFFIYSNQEKPLKEHIKSGTCDYDDLIRLKLIKVEQVKEIEEQILREVIDDLNKKLMKVSESSWFYEYGGDNNECFNRTYFRRLNLWN